MTYRKDIDGLRAVAVLPVVLYHAGLGCPGGFVGVDVFFVMSGYLITALITADIDQGKFSLANFYERRVRRIFPALFAMILATTIAAWLWFMPPDFALFGKSALAAALFVSNHLFRQEAGYFDVSDVVKPLLHTWSLAVEEQFYIFFPLLLVLSRRHPRLRRALLIVLTSASLALSQYWLKARPDDAFYLLPARFWELGLGALMTELVTYQPKRVSTAAATSLIGLCLIGLAVVFYSPATAFPGVAALLPCLGAALVILGGRRANPVSSLLASPPIAFIGLISYSLYLWHWPLIVFGQYQLGHLLTAHEAWLVVGLSIIVAILSWRLIELPVRQRRWLPRRAPLFKLAVAAMAVTCFAGFSIKHFHGFPDRLPEDVARIYAAKNDITDYMRPTCFTDTKLRGPGAADVRNGRLCGIGATEAAPSFVVWGDSHSGAIAPAIDLAAAAQGQKGLLAGEGGCPPLLDYEIKQVRPANREACLTHNQAVLDLVRDQHIHLVFLVARWPREVLGGQYGNEGPFFDPAAPYETEDRAAKVAAALDRTLAALAQLHCRAVLVMDVPEAGYDLPYTLARAARDHRLIDVNPPRAVVEQRQAAARQILLDAAAKYHAGFVDPTSRFCDPTRCAVEIDGRPLYIDADHLTRTTALSLHGLFDASFTAAADTAVTDDRRQN